MVMIKRISSKDLDEVELVPQAILDLPISYFATEYGAFETREDDFDIYEGADFAISSGVKFSLRRYRGYPKDTTTIYLPSGVSSVGEVSALLSTILNGLNLQTSAVKWQRSDNPEL